MANPAVLLVSGVGGAAILGAGYGLWVIHKRSRRALPSGYAPPGLPAGFASAALAGLPAGAPHQQAAHIVSTALANGAIHPAAGRPASAPGVTILPWHAGYDRLDSTQTMYLGDARQSPSKGLTLELIDGALSLYDTRKGRTLIWGTGRRNGDHLLMQDDGNLVLYPASGKSVWDTKTWGNSRAFLRLQDDGNMIVYHGKDARWETGTYKFKKGDLNGKGISHPPHGFNLGELAAIAIGVPPGVFTAVMADPAANRWVGNAVKTAGRDVSAATHAIEDESGKISKALGKIPIVGPLLSGLYDASFMGTFGLLVMTEHVVVEGERVDRAALDQLKTQLKDFKEIGPYAQMVCSLIPGIGTGISAAIGVGLALANGQGIAEALLAGVEAAVPGGPLAKMAFDVAQKSIVAAVEHKPLNWGLIASTTVEVAADVIDIPVPDPVKKMLEGGMTCAAQLVQGKKLDGALVAGFANALPVGDEVKIAISTVTQASVDLAEGKKLTTVMLTTISHAVKLLPVDSSTKHGIMSGVSVDGATTMNGESIFGTDAVVPSEQALSMRIQHCVTDIFLDRGKAGLKNQKAADAINIAIAVHMGKIVQDTTAPQFAANGPVMSKLLVIGQDLLKTDEVVSAGYDSLTAGQTGYLVGAALMRQQCNTHQLLAMRENLETGDDKKSFDIALSLHIGRVVNPPPKTALTSASKMAYYTTLGVQGGQTQQKTAIVKTLAENPDTKPGTAQAIKTVAKRRDGVLPRIKRAIGLEK